MAKEMKQMEYQVVIYRDSVGNLRLRQMGRHKAETGAPFIPIESTYTGWSGLWEGGFFSQSPEEEKPCDEERQKLVRKIIELTKND